MASHLEGINVGQASKHAVYKTDENGKVSVYNKYGTLIASGFADKEGAKGAIKQLERNYIAEREKQRAYMYSAINSLKTAGAWQKMTPEERAAARKTVLRDVTVNYYDNLNDSMRADNGTLSTYFDRYKATAAATTTTTAAATAPAATVNNTAVATKPNTLASSSLPTKNTVVQAPVAQPAVQAPVAQAPAVQTYQPATTQTTQAQPTAAQRVVAAKTQFQSAPSRVVNNAGTQTSQVTSSRRRPNSLVADRYASLRKQ